MSGEEAVRLRLLELTALTELVATRIYMAKLPQSPTYPCVLVDYVSEITKYHLRGQDQLLNPLIQVDALAREVSGVDPYALVIAVAEAVHGDGAGSGLSGWVGPIGGSPASYVSGCFRETRRKYYDPDERRVVHMSQDYRVSFRA